jgi:hypothetical protein
MVKRSSFGGIGVLLGLLALPLWLFAQETAEEEEPAVVLQPLETGGQTIPELFRRPSRGEAPRYPRDAGIGDWGRGSASEDAYVFARALLAALLQGEVDAESPGALSPGRWGELRESLGGISPEKYRIGGGRQEIDGATSFLFRFIGREQGIAGELYLRVAEEVWQVDDIILEDPRDATGKAEAYPYDFTPYERFF